MYFAPAGHALEPEIMLELDEAEARHAATVSRMRIGEEVMLTDGAGSVAQSVVTELTKRTVQLRVISVVHESAPSPQLILVQALAKTDRAERAVEAATEVGVDRVLPWQAERSVSKWDAAKQDKGRQRWQGIAREATKQSIRAFCPEVSPLVSTAQIAQTLPGSLLLVLDPEGDEQLSQVNLEGAASIAVVVGPEGGITPSELSALKDAGAHLVRLGTHVLRTSTAGPAALAVLQARLGRW